LIADIAKIFLGAFFGAACAFAYERRRKSDEEQSRRSVVLRDAQFALIARIIRLLNVHQDYLVPQEKNQNRWIELHPVLFVTNPPLIPMAELSFLLEDVEPIILAELEVAKGQFDTVCAMINRRNEMHEEFQRLFESGNTSERLKVQLAILTDDLYEHVPDAVLSLYSVHCKLGKVMKRNFKNVEVLSIHGDPEQMIKKLQERRDQKVSNDQEA